MIVLNGCSRTVFERNFFKRVSKKWSATGRGAFSVSLFFLFFLFFFWKFVRRVWAVFAFDIFVPPLSLFFFPPHSSIDSCTSKIGVRLIARKRISRDFGLTVCVFFFPSLSLWNFYPARWTVV